MVLIILPDFIVDSFTTTKCNKKKMGFPGGSDSKESAFNAGDLGSKPGLGRSPGGGHGNPFQCSCPGNPHGQRSLESYSPWVAKSWT